MLLNCGSKTLDLTRPLVMGILNVTPDSFSDGGRFNTLDAAVDHAHQLVEEGAAILDIGGESTRPGADAVPVEEELRRVLPVVERLVSYGIRAVLSVDTNKPQVMRAVAAAGADLINDVSGLTQPGALEAAASTGCAVCLMHMKGEPRTMQLSPHYDDVVGEVRGFLQHRVRACIEAGIGIDRLLIDPGFGFGKTREHNLELLRRLRELVIYPEPSRAADAIPLLVGLSRKSMLGAITGRVPEERVYGSIALAVIAVLNGARIVRAHDVAATVDAIKTTIAVRGG